MTKTDAVIGALVRHSITGSSGRIVADKGGVEAGPGVSNDTWYVPVRYGARVVFSDISQLVKVVRLS